jgi:lipoate-protein ligase B
MTALTIHDLGRAGYGQTLALQRRLVEQVKDRPEEAHLLLVEHDPAVITLGRRGQRSDILAGDAELARRGIEIHESSRGGLVTWHGPGQLVAYPIVPLGRRGRDVRGHVANLEQTVLGVLGEFGIAGRRREGLIGVWVDSPGANPQPRKVAAVGVAVHRWVSYHGVALNVCADLSAFDLINPCGLGAGSATSLGELLGRDVPVEDVKPIFVRQFERVFAMSA